MARQPLPEPVAPQDHQLPLPLVSDDDLVNELLSQNPDLQREEAKELLRELGIL